MADISLLLTIVQASATFVAILAGFYTTKILSISSEKKKLESKIKDIDNELSSKRKMVDNLKTQIDNIHNRWDEEAVESFAKYLIAEPFFYSKIATFGDIVQRFNEYYEKSPSENQLKILEKKSSSIIEEIQKNKRDMIIKMRSSPSPSVQFHKALQDSNEIKNRDKLNDQLNYEKNRILLLEESRRTYVEDFKSLVYPKYVKFGYISFIIFAASGVIFPLTYKWWPLYMLNNSEIFGLSGFIIGLIFTFLCLYLELKNALSVYSISK